MKNVSVFESNSGIGTISDNVGFYKLLLKSGSVKMQFSDSGFDAVAKSFELSRDTTLIVYLISEKAVKDFIPEKISDIHADVQPEKKADFSSGNTTGKLK